jgi:hypothetical protein
LARDAEEAEAMSRVKDQFDDTTDFEQLLSDAESQAKSEREQEFVAEMNDKWEKYGADMFLSEKQRDWLESIVG